MICWVSGNYCHAGLLFHFCPDVTVAPLLTHLTVRPESNGYVDKEKDPGDLANVADETTSHVHRLSINSLYLQTHDLLAQWFWTLLSSLSNSKPVGDWTPIVPRTDAPHFQQKAASSRSSLPHFQQYTNGILGSSNLPSWA